VKVGLGVGKVAEVGVTLGTISSAVSVGCEEDMGTLVGLSTICNVEEELGVTVVSVPHADSSSNRNGMLSLRRSFFNKTHLLTLLLYSPPLPVQPA
jgi:hypothetical protein